MTGRTDGPAGALVTLARDLARDAGRVIVEMRSAAVVTATTKSSPTDPVTDADRASESIVVEGIRRARPDDGIVGEEGTDHSGTSGVLWYIDPIDGTANYLYGIPAYSVSVAVGRDDGSILCGVVYNPVTDELFEALAGAGATLNGRPISATDQQDLAATMLGTGFGYRAQRRRHQAAIIAELLPEVRDLRRFGSAALDLCAVGCGRLDAYYEAGLNAWDFAAGWLIATEAGAICDDLRGGPPSTGFMLAAAPGIHRSLGDRLRHLDADRMPD